MTSRIFGALFGEGRAFIGVVHLPALPGSPRWAGNMDLVLDRAEEEALALQSGGPMASSLRISAMPPSASAGWIRKPWPV